MRSPLARAGTWLAAAFGCLLLALVATSLLYPQLTAQVVAHATPNLSPLFNFFASNTHAAGNASDVVLALAPIAVMRTDLKKLLKEIDDTQAKHEGTRMPADVATQVDAKAATAMALQEDIEKQERLEGLRSFAGKVSPATATLPEDEGGTGAETKDEKAQRESWERRNIKGYVRLGDYVAMSKGLQEFKGRGYPREGAVLCRIPSLLGPVVGLTAQGLRELKTAYQQAETDEHKAVPDIGGTLNDVVIEPTRVAEVIRVLEQDRVTLRNVLDIQRTTSDAIKYTRITNYTRAAAAVAHGARKPEAGIALDSKTEIVRTIAVWIPVQNQQLDDLPALAGIINGELLYDVNKHEEELVMYGSGEDEEFMGILRSPDVAAARTVSGDTLIDIARRGITDVRRAGYEPNGILADPLDWEEIVLEKGSDNRYVWVVVTEAGVQRLWGVPVIETVAMSDFAGVNEEERNLLVGDFRRGATLYDRQDASISVGWINEQFIENQRTILAEKRAAFALKRPGAFRKYTTQEASAS